MALASEGEGEVGSQGGFADTAFGRGDGDGVGDGRDAAARREAALGAPGEFGGVCRGGRGRAAGEVEGVFMAGEEGVCGEGPDLGAEEGRM